MPEVSNVAKPETSRRAVPSDALNPEVRQETIQQTICIPGYTASVRPEPAFTSKVKLRLMREQSLPNSEAAGLELDHRVALAVGGHPRALVNLQLQHWEGDDGAKRKDRLEKRLQTLVCAGTIPLGIAQSALYWDWQSAYSKYIR